MKISISDLVGSVVRTKSFYIFFFNFYSLLKLTFFAKSNYPLSEIIDIIMFIGHCVDNYKIGNIHQLSRNVVNTFVLSIKKDS